MNKTGVIAKISIKYVLPTCIWKYFWRISRYFAFFWEFRGISRKYQNFAGPRPREISEALTIHVQTKTPNRGGSLDCQLGERVRDACYENPLLFVSADTGVHKFLIG